MFHKVAIIIVTYNAQKYLEGCFGSLREQNYPSEAVKIIAVDNASTDGSAKTIKRNFPEVCLMESSKNLGFAGGNNLGMKKALEDGADFVVLLNQDTVVEKNWLDELIKKAAAGPTIGAVQSLLLLWDDKNLIQTSGNCIHYLGFGYSGNYKSQRPMPNAQRPNDIAYASGAAVLLKREVLEKVGLLDEDLFLYHEDLDLGWRIRLVGYEIKRADKSIVYHKYSFSRNKAKNYYMERNRFFVLLKNYKFATILLILPALILMEAGMIFYALLNGWLGLKIKSYVDFARGLPAVLAKRKKIQKMRQVKDKDIIKFFAGKIEFEELRNPILKYIANPILNGYWQIVKRIIWW